MKLLYLSPVPLASFAQRPHHFVRWFHERFGAPVLWLEPPPARLPRWSDLRLLRPRTRGSVALASPWTHEPWIERLRMPALPFEPWAAGRAINALLQRGGLRTLDSWVDEQTWLVLAKPCALALTLQHRYASCPSLFDVMDAMPEFSHGPSRRWVAQCETALASRCTYLTASAPSLLARLGVDPTDRRVGVIPNGLVPPKSIEPIEDTRRPAPPDKPLRFVYVGVMAGWFDWDAVLALALRFPASPIRLIGPCHHPPPTAMPVNVQICGPLPHEAIPAVFREADIGLIPFRDNELTRHVDPVKFYEYRAAGLGVLSTRFGTMTTRSRDDQVIFFDTRPNEHDLRTLARAAAEETVRKDFCAAHAWSQRFERLVPWFTNPVGHQSIQPLHPMTTV